MKSNTKQKWSLAVLNVAVAGVMFLSLANS